MAIEIKHCVDAMDMEAIKLEQILTTLKYINKHCKDTRLTHDEKNQSIRWWRKY